MRGIGIDVEAAEADADACEGQQKREDEQLQMSDGNWVRAGRAGLFYPVVSLGEEIVKGGLIGHIANLFGHTIEEITSPVDGIVFGLRHIAVANVGDYIANIGNLA